MSRKLGPSYLWNKVLWFRSWLFADFGEIGFQCREVIFKQKPYLPEYWLEVKDRSLAWFAEQALVWWAVLLQKRGKSPLAHNHESGFFLHLQSWLIGCWKTAMDELTSPFILDHCNWFRFRCAQLPATAEHNLSKEENNKRYILFKAKLTLVSSESLRESESLRADIVKYKGKGNESMLCMIKLGGCTSGVPCCRLFISVSGSQSTNHRGQELPGETCPSWGPWACLTAL